MHTAALKRVARRTILSVAAGALAFVAAVGSADDRPGKRLVIPKYRDHQ